MTDEAAEPQDLSGLQNLLSRFTGARLPAIRDVVDNAAPPRRFGPLPDQALLERRRQLLRSLPTDVRAFPATLEGLRPDEVLCGLDRWLDRLDTESAPTEDRDAIATVALIYLTLVGLAQSDPSLADPSSKQARPETRTHRCRTLLEVAWIRDALLDVYDRPGTRAHQPWREKRRHDDRLALDGRNSHRAAPVRDDVADPQGSHERPH